MLGLESSPELLLTVKVVVPIEGLTPKEESSLFVAVNVNVPPNL